MCGERRAVCVQCVGAGLLPVAEASQLQELPAARRHGAQAARGRVVSVPVRATLLAITLGYTLPAGISHLLEYLISMHHLTLICQTEWEHH